MPKITSYQEALEYLGNKRERPFANNTRIERDPLALEHDVIVAKYHGHTVASFYPEYTAYSSAGWRTPTTKERINWFLPDGFYLYQEAGNWFIQKRGNGSRWTFADGITIDHYGNVCNDAPAGELERTKALTKAIKAFVNGYIKALLAGEVESPSGGDCWYCCMRTEDGRSLGEASNNTDHLESHLEESYYVPSLLYNAVEKTGRASAISKDGIQRLWQDETISEFQADCVVRDVKSCLTRYFKLAFGIAGK